MISTGRAARELSPDLLDTISVVRGIREAQRKRNVQARPR